MTAPTLSATWSALGTYVFLAVGDAHLLAPARALAESEISELDRTCSRFREDSALMTVNRQAGTWVTAPSMLLDAVQTAIKAAQDTEGLVDPTLGAELTALGYDTDLDAVRARPTRVTPTAIPIPPPRVDRWREIELRSDAIRIPLDARLDVGATGKAFGSDRIAAAVVAELGVDCIISLGGDIAIGVASTPPQHWWGIDISERPDTEPAESIVVNSGGFATSTTVHRTWQHQGRTVHHLLDPRTGQPIERSWRTASVAATTCVAANTATTAALIMGDAAPEWLTQHAVSARLVHTDGTVHYVGTWPPAPLVER